VQLAGTPGDQFCRSPGDVDVTVFSESTRVVEERFRVYSGLGAERFQVGNLHGRVVPVRHTRGVTFQQREEHLAGCILI